MGGQHGIWIGDFGIGSHHVQAALPPALSFSVRVKGRRRTHTLMRLSRAGAAEALDAMRGEPRGERESDSNESKLGGTPTPLQTAQRARAAAMGERSTVAPSTS
jgi:hypothetical protein